MSTTMPGGCPLLQTETCSSTQLQSRNHLSVAEALPAVACCTCLLLGRCFGSHLRRCCLLYLAASWRHAYRLRRGLCFPLLPAPKRLCVRYLLLPPFAVCPMGPQGQALPFTIARGGCFDFCLPVPASGGHTMADALHVAARGGCLCLWDHTDSV